MNIYVVTWENDGDFPLTDVRIATTDHRKALETAKERPEGYALSIICTYRNNQKIRSETYEDNFDKPERDRCYDDEDEYLPTCPKCQTQAKIDQFWVCERCGARWQEGDQA